MGRERKKIEVEAGALISFSKYTGVSPHYGSEIDPKGGITISISKAYADVDGGDVYYMDKSGLPLIRVRMSYLQFYEAIGAEMNRMGVPCTLEIHDGKHIRYNKEDKEVNELSLAEIHIEGKIDDTKKDVKQLKAMVTEIAAKKNVTKKDINEIKYLVEKIDRDVDKNLSWYASQIREKVSKLKMKAKNEISSFHESVVYRLGLSSIKQMTSVEENVSKALGDK